ncbi:DNA polymerase/3'-5' exonuclease PolX [Candidatus Daviesbacteria bacterium]|nr:DNA polymerase/3'-5' exonuclease PolX [Candidatus Daviesbacteria bacterium]
MAISNQQLAKILKNIAAAYVIKNLGNIFQIRAYENAASSVENSTVEIHDLWQEGKLSEVPNLGSRLQEYLDELFKTGKVKHFEQIQQGIPEIVFDLLDITGIGPKTAQKLSFLGVKNLEDLKKKIKSGELVDKGFSAKIAQNIMLGLHDLNQREGRMLLPYAAAAAEKILNYLKQNSLVLQAHPLGSLRRMVATVGDLDFAVSSEQEKEVVDYFCKMPEIVRIIDKGENKATVIFKSGVQGDLLVGQPESYGALLQHFTGSKSHNIKLRILASKKGFSLSEYGIKKVTRVKSQESREELITAETEEEIYKTLGMQTPLPEIREDTGEIEAALEHKLPALVELREIKGDLHLHSNFPLVSPSHGPGVDSIEEIIEKAISLGYEFVGVSDHPPGFTSVSKEDITKWVEKRTKFIQDLKKRTKSIRVLNGLEIDILGDGNLSVPDEALVTLDYCIAGIHSGHRRSREKITARLIKALENPHVDIISHPTNRLLNERESSEADWEEIFKLAAKNNKILEINAFPNRLDLRDDLIRQALQYGVKFIINTDAHQVTQMDNMRFGVAVARRGWATKRDIINCWDWTKFARWFNI